MKHIPLITSLLLTSLLLGCGGSGSSSSGANDSDEPKNSFYSFEYTKNGQKRAFNLQEWLDHHQEGFRYYAGAPDVEWHTRRHSHRDGSVHPHGHGYKRDRFPNAPSVPSICNKKSAYCDTKH